jgi:hypothetical protein
MIYSYNTTLFFVLFLTCHLFFVKSQRVLHFIDLTDTLRFVVVWGINALYRSREKAGGNAQTDPNGDTIQMGVRRKYE